MRKIEIIDADEIEDMLFYDDIFDTPLIHFAKQCVELYKKRGNKWIPNEEEQIERGLSIEERDKEDEAFFDEYSPLEDDCLDAQRKLIKAYLAEDRTGKA